MAIVIVIAIIFVLLIVLFSQYNSIVTLQNKVKQSRSGIDVYLKERFDLIPNLVSLVKKYMEYEQDTLVKIVDLREKYNNTKDIEVSKELNDQLNKVIAVAENYPDLKASEQFLNLQKNLSKMESQLQAARRIYNNDVNNYNTKISVVPSNIIASIFGFKKEDLFEINEGEKENININEMM